MNLHKTALKFNKSLFQEYGGSATFYGQVQPYTEGVRSAAPTRRRILEVGPDVTIPASKVVSTNGKTYVLGSPAYDFHRGSVIRVKYAMTPVDTFFTVKTIQQLVNNQAGTVDLAATPYLAEVAVASLDRYYRMPRYELYFSSNYSFPVDSVFFSSFGTFLSTMQSGLDGVGFSMSEVVEAEANAIRNVTVVSNRGKDLVSEAATIATYTNVPALVVYARFGFEFVTGDSKDVESGDYIAWVSKTTVVYPPKEGSTVDGMKVVAYKEQPIGVWEVRLRLA